MRKAFYLHRRGRIWYAEYRDPVTGEISSPKSTKQSNKAAAEKAASTEAARLAELTDFPPMSLGEWGERFFKPGCPHVSRLKIEGKQVSDRYIKSCRQNWDNHIKSDQICSVQLYSLRRAHVLAFRTRLVENVGQTRTAQAVWSTLHIVIREAFFHGLSDRDPCVGIGQIAYEGKRRVVLTIEQVKALLIPELWDNSPYYLPTKAAALTGMRRGEIRGLLWSDLHPELNLIAVDHNLPGSAGAGHDTDPKWHKHRLTAYPKTLQADLEPLRKEKGYVFLIKGKPLGGNRWLEKFKEIAESEKVNAPGATLHSLRHSLNTYLIDKGANKTLLQDSFGWSGEEVQELYTHSELFNYSAQRKMVDKEFGKKEKKHGHV